MDGHAPCPPVPFRPPSLQRSTRGEGRVKVKENEERKAPPRLSRRGGWRGSEGRQGGRERKERQERKTQSRVDADRSKREKDSVRG